MKKVVFIDIDGTLVHGSEIVPESAIKACKIARENGHKLYLCTGRSKTEIYDHILEVGFDGIIGAGGGYIESDGEVVMHQHVDMDTLDYTLKFFNEHGIHHCVETNDGLYISEGYREHLRGLMNYADDFDSHPFVKALRDGQSLMRNDVNKVCFMGNHELPFSKLSEMFESYYEVHQSTVAVFGETSGELAIKGVSKSNAIDVLLNHLNMSKEDTVSIGDGDNDIDMFEFTKLSIAMENATPKLKDVSDWITSSVGDDGLYNAFKYAKLI